MASIQPLPLYELWYPQVIVIQDADAAAKQLAEIMPDIPGEGDIIGISITLTHTNHIRIVSVFHSDSAYTFDLRLIGAFPPHLKCLLEDEDVVKIGHGILNIAWRLYDEHDIKMTMGGEISRLHRIFDNTHTNIGEPFDNPVPLSIIAERWLRKTIVSEYVQCRWGDMFELVHYKHSARMAAIVGQSYQAMREGNRVDSVADKFWVFTGVDYATGTVLGRCDEFPLHTVASASCIEPLRRAAVRVRATLSEADRHVQRMGIPVNVEGRYSRIFRLCEEIEAAFRTYDSAVQEPE